MGELIIRLRGELAGQGVDAGPHTIAWHLAEQHQLTVSVATIWRPPVTPSRSPATGR
jgi:hypothetical protein